MRGKLITLYLLIVAISLFAIYWKMDRDFFGEKMASNEAQSRSQLASLTRATQAELEGLTQILDLALPTLLDSKKDTYAADQAFGRFQMIAKVSGQGLNARLDSVFTLDKSPVHSWGPTYAVAALRNASTANAGDAEPGAVHLWTVLDPNRKVWFLYDATSAVTQMHYAALLPADLLQGLLDRQKGQESLFAVVNGDAQVMAHTTAEYIGQLLTQDPLVQMVQTSGRPMGSGLFDGLQGERVQGFYEKVNGTNLFVTISTPVRVLLAQKSHLKFRFLYLGIGLSLIGVCLILLFQDSTPAGSTNPIVVSVPASVPVRESNFVGGQAPAPMPEAPKMPVPPPTPAAAVQELVRAPELVPQVEKFEALFSDSKVAGALEMIDTLDDSPPPHPTMSELRKAPSDSAVSFPAPPIRVEASPPPPPWAGVKKPLLDLPETHSKLDEFVVKIRKPRGPSGEAT